MYLEGKTDSWIAKGRFVAWVFLFGAGWERFLSAWAGFRDPPPGSSSSTGVVLLSNRKVFEHLALHPRKEPTLGGHAEVARETPEV